MSYYFVTFKFANPNGMPAEGNFVIKGDFNFIKEAENLKQKYGLADTPLITGIYVISELMYEINKE